ncbi:7,8-didemethyl-8-hydroxy-5-deazariboflavin synthase CofG [Candidatus Bathyarchaeota archaeon]|nr:7,8-didemethyl-8-hydroxy-5-deazariboflavin synthase CofG [Candidatus Bathyarchaeota archaeon]
MRFDPRLDEVLMKALGGSPPTREEAYQLLNSTERDLPGLVYVASAIRDREKGKRISYSKKVLIPLSNLCRNHCGYCGFRKDPAEPAARIMSQDEALRIAELGDRSGCREALFILGERPESTHPEASRRLRRLGYSTMTDYLLDTCELILEKTKLLPHTNAGVLTREELERLRDVNASIGIMLENSSVRLCLEGGPHQNSPGKNPRLRLRMIEEAGRLKIPFTTGLLVGIGETPEERADSLLELKRLHDEYNHIQELIIQSFCPKPGTPMEGWPQPHLSEVMRTVAAARIIFQGRTNIQTPPNLVHQRYREVLAAGINDWGGISNITDDQVNPEEPWPRIEALEEITSGEGFELRMRLPVYPEYVKRIPGFLPGRLQDRILSMVDDEGYVKEDGL